MTFDEIIAALKQVQHMCQTNPDCKDCPFDHKNSIKVITCRLSSETPDLWYLDYLERGNNDK